MKKKMIVSIAMLGILSAPCAFAAHTDGSTVATVAIESQNGYVVGTVAAEYAAVGWNPSGQAYAEANAAEYPYRTENIEFNQHTVTVTANTRADGFFTATEAAGQVAQFNVTGVSSQNTFALGENYSSGSFHSDDYGFCHSDSDGVAGTNSFSQAYQNTDGAKIAEATTANTTFAYGEKTYVEGGGLVATLAQEFTPVSSAVTTGYAQFDYAGKNIGGGIATSNSTISQINGVTVATSTASAYSSAGAGSHLGRP